MTTLSVESLNQLSDLIGEIEAKKLELAIAVQKVESTKHSNEIALDAFTKGQLDTLTNEKEQAQIKDDIETLHNQESQDLEESAIVISKKLEEYFNNSFDQFVQTVLAKLKIVNQQGEVVENDGSLSFVTKTRVYKLDRASLKPYLAKNMLVSSLK